MANSYFDQIRLYLHDLGGLVEYSDPARGIFVVSKPELGISQLVVGCAEPLLILEQHLLTLPEPTLRIYQRLLQKNRDIIHGAFVLDESGRRVIFRDTLQIATLDRDELDACFNSLGLLLSEFATELIAFSKG
jgi:hypothetical protein